MDVAIVGAGITGLTAALSLRRTGHRVTIYERSSLNNEIGAAINVPPNVGRFLLPLGLDPVRAGFVESTGMYFMSPKTLEERSFYDHSSTAKVFGAPLYYAHRVDLHESLKNLATEPDGPGVPVTVHLKSGVSSYNPDTPSVTLFDGTVITADLVIAADGVHSTATEAVLGGTNPPQPAKHANCCYRFLISRADLEEDPATRFFNRGHRQLGCRIFADPEARRRLVTYTTRNHEIHNFAAICYRDDVMSKREDWHAAVEKAELLETLSGYHPSLLAVVNKATEVKRWPLLYRPPIKTWYKGKMALAGDAAHPMLPHHGQGGAQGMEDGLALGLVLHGVTDASQIEQRLAIYENVRRNRAASIQILSNFGYDEVAPDELVDFLEGRPIPSTMDEMVQLAYSSDVVERVMQYMTEFDPSFKLPDRFFSVDPKRT
ncbi:FAD/NAD(P)-binding domain-containing protein [Stipitochalara longipes BDJ]|nr:FAD/NAD(P)-binding domain-containing protein [Stipitochalara longipes BDJ]